MDTLFYGQERDAYFRNENHSQATDFLAEEHRVPVSFQFLHKDTVLQRRRPTDIDTCEEVNLSDGFGTLE
ncbi:unnamed protein product [Anisakis simplex]|uniref:UBX domain-containing protein n=1 Tax=Anisakis simplex TaxID=6269 RepID=A0A0M3KB77_ANISI|nr:unnamed protein product [Anisakis simplex]